jgi:hypothetical protein
MALVPAPGMTSRSQSLFWAAAVRVSDPATVTYRCEVTIDSWPRSRESHKFVRVNDPMWSHDLRWWLLAMGLLSALWILVAVMVCWRLRLAVLCRYIDRVARRPELTARRRGRDRLLNNHLVRLVDAAAPKIADSKRSNAHAFYPPGA